MSGDGGALGRPGPDADGAAAAAPQTMATCDRRRCELLLELLIGEASHLIREGEQLDARAVLDAVAQRGGLQRV